MSVDANRRKPSRTASKPEVSGRRLDEIVKRAKDGDVQAFHELYGIFGEKILNYVYRLTGSREDAEDLTQDTFVLAFRKLNSLKENRKIQSWLFRIAQNNVFQKYRGKGPQIESLDDDESAELSQDRKGVSAAKTPEETALAGELEEIIDQVIQQLPPKYREVFVLSALHKMSYQEISEVVNRSLASVKSDIHRARVAVRDQIKEYLGDNYGMSQMR